MSNKSRGSGAFVSKTKQCPYPAGQKMHHSAHVPGGLPGVSPGSTPGKSNDKCITVNDCQQFSIHVLIHLAVFFWIGMKGDGLLYIKVILQVTTRYFFCLHLKKLLTFFCLQQYVSLRWFDRSVEHYSDVYNGRRPNVYNICTISF